MEEAYGGKIKIEHVKESIPRDFLNNIHAYKDRVGIVAFSDDVIVATTPVSNYEKVKDSIDKLNPSGFNSNIKDAMQTAITILKFKREKSIPILILITDGGKDESTVNEELIIKELKEEGITLYVFNIGEDSNVEDFLKRACNETGGFYRKIEPTTLGINLKEIAVSKETLSAANVKLRIEQTDNAVLNYYSVTPKIVGTKSLEIITHNKLEYYISKLPGDSGFEFVFELVPYNKYGNLTVAKFIVEYMDKDGSIKKIQLPISVELTPSHSGWILYILLVVLVALAIVVVIFIRENYKLKRKIEVARSRAQNVQNLIDRKYRKLVEDIINALM